MEQLGLHGPSYEASRAATPCFLQRLRQHGALPGASGSCVACMASPEGGKQT